MRKILPRKTSVNEAERPAEKRAPRICAREGCEAELNKHAGRANFCSVACAKAARAEIERPSVRHRPLTSGERRAIYSGDAKLGEILPRDLPRGREFVAHNRRGEAIGVFDDVHSAVAAIMRAAA
jgi:hypothetical protein